MKRNNYSSCLTISPRDAQRRCGVRVSDGQEKAIVGIVQLITKPYSQQHDAGSVLSELSAAQSLKHPVTLFNITSSKEYLSLDVVHLPRIAVMPVRQKFWKLFLKLRTIPKFSSLY